MNPLPDCQHLQRASQCQRRSGVFRWDVGAIRSGDRSAGGVIKWWSQLVEGLSDANHLVESDGKRPGTKFSEAKGLTKLHFYVLLCGDARVQEN